MKRDIIDLYHVLQTQDDMRLGINICNDDGEPICFINPSSTEHFVYFRTLLRSNMYVSNICMYNKQSSKFVSVTPHTECPLIEDLRIFDYRDRVWFVGYMRRKDNQIFETFVGMFSSECDEIETVAGVIRNTDVHMKNITPLVIGQSLWLIDILNGSVYTHTDTNEIEYAHSLDMTLLHEKMAPYTGLMCGTTQYVHIQDSIYGGLAHITKKLGAYTYYVYVWIEIDTATWSISFVSKPYIIHKLGLVFVSHIEKTSDNNFQLMFGRNDVCAYRCTTSLQDLRGMD